MSATSRSDLSSHFIPNDIDSPFDILAAHTIMSGEEEKALCNLLGNEEFIYGISESKVVMKGS